MNGLLSNIALNPEWFSSTSTTWLRILASTVCAYVALIVLVRINGLRTFSKMSGFDFAMTVAIGSVFATIITSKDVSVLDGLAAFASLIAVQAVIAILRKSIPGFPKVVDNDPLLLMRGSEVLHSNLRKGRVTEADLRAKLREANVLKYSQVLAVVLETPGDISVLHCSDSATSLDPDLLEGVSK